MNQEALAIIELNQAGAAERVSPKVINLKITLTPKATEDKI